MQVDPPAVSVILPCYNEAGAIEATVRELVGELDGRVAYELLVVNDGSTDGSAELLQQMIASGSFPAMRVLTHEENRGYGAALKTGLRAARGELIAITDADGTYPADRLMELIERAPDCEMVVGARTEAGAAHPPARVIPKALLKAYAEWLVRRSIPDMNSGMRVFRKSAAARFTRLLPDGFSFTTTITLAMLASGDRVQFVPVAYAARVGKSKIQPVRDTLRFFSLILRTGMYFAPLRVLSPVALLLALLTVGKIIRDIIVESNITDSSLLLALFTLNTVLLMLIADLINKRG